MRTEDIADLLLEAAGHAQRARLDVPTQPARRGEEREELREILTELRTMREENRKMLEHLAQLLRTMNRLERFGELKETSAGLQVTVVERDANDRISRVTVH